MKKVFAVLALAGLGLGGGVAYADHDADFPCDVEANNVHLRNIERAHELGITVGSDASCSYAPKDFVRREQMASFLTNTYDAAVADSAGTVGATGADGATGAEGPMGPAGPAGADGMAGIAGIDGIDGVAGPIGETGLTGLTGPIGEPGMTPEEITALTAQITTLTERISVLEALVQTLTVPLL